MQQRLQQMQQEILSRSSLSELIQRPSLDLYRKERARYPMEDIIQDMRNKAIRIQTVEVNRTASAFTISFSYPDRFKAQAVVRELVTKFTEQNVTVQRNQANLTTQFLGDELKQAKDKMDSLEAAGHQVQEREHGPAARTVPGQRGAVEHAADDARARRTKR